MASEHVRDMKSATDITRARAARPARETAASVILARLRTAILDLSLPPGTALIEKDLTERFGVSRTPVREAIIRLAEERLVDIFPQSGTFVGRIPLAALPEAVIIRKALETAALDLAVDRADASSFAAFDALIARQTALADLSDQNGFHAADEEFHELIALTSGHPGIWRVAQQAKMQIDRCRRLTLPEPGRMHQVIAEHRAILAALRAGERKVARNALDTHLSAVIPDADAIRRQYPDYFT
ncbi:GntR family transcriptional regulator [Candidatus Raskinella chloraquaticus]